MSQYFQRAFAITAGILAAILLFCVVAGALYIIVRAYVHFI